MLIEVQIANYRSIRARQKFSMVSDQGKEHLASHTIKTKEANLGRLLKSAAIYGGNSAGKTNILRALLFMKEFVLNSAHYQPGGRIPFEPFNRQRHLRSIPQEFSVSFIEQDTRYDYSFATDANSVRFEQLISYPEGKPRVLFTRERKTERERWTINKTYVKGPKETWKASTKRNSLFLSVAVQNNSKDLLPAFEWFQKKLVVAAAHAQLNRALTIRKIETDPKAKQSVLAFVREADPSIVDFKIERQIIQPGAMVLGGGKNVVLEQTNQGTRLTRVSFVHRTEEKGFMMLRQEDESSGAVALFENAGAWLNVLSNGEVLLFDEMDSSLHPFLAKFLVQQFNSQKTNRRGAQLIFTTHNSYLLNQEIFRRDQIWFVEKQFNGESEIYPLTRFSPRKETEDVRKFYFQGRYGALPILSAFED